MHHDRTGGAGRGHPRGCGEQCGPWPRVAGHGGPSPRVRGAVDAVGGGEVVDGAIPAGAGSRAAGRASAGARGGHPRGCGEQTAAAGAAVGGMGPSPRVRGAVRFGLPAALAAGAIPAGAGSRPAPPTPPRYGWGHPRGCGEQEEQNAEFHVDTGPSPRVRGAEASSFPRRWVSGAIPAGAGSRHRPGCWLPPPRGHPRGCGEQLISEAGREDATGPSPRVRGAEHGEGHRPELGGAIPAGAGSRPNTTTPWPTPRGHPRGCGEQGSAAGTTPRVRGPSPRVRGAGQPSRRLGDVRGAIPAGAGSSWERSRKR